MSHKLFKVLSFLTIVIIGNVYTVRVALGEVDTPPYYYMYLCGILIAIDRIYSKPNN